MESTDKEIKTNSFYCFCSILICLGIIFTPFNHTKIGELIPTSLTFILSNEDAYSMYIFLFFSLLYFFYKIANHNTKDYKNLLLFFCVYLFINTIVHIHALIISPYLKNADFQLLNGSNALVFNITKKLFPSYSNYFVYCISSTLKQFVSNTTFFSSSFFIIFSLYLFYKDSKRNYMHHFWLSTVISTAFILLFEVIEIMHILGFSWAKDFIKLFFNSIYHIARGMNGWWPPEIQNQIRAVFPEASHFSYWGAVSLMVLLYGMKKENKIISIIEYSLLSFAVLSSDSRTGTALVCGGIISFIALALIANYKQNLKIIITIIVLTTLAILTSAFFLNNYSKLIGLPKENTIQVSNAVSNDKNEQDYEEHSTENNNENNNIVTSYLQSSLGYSKLIGLPKENTIQVSNAVSNDKNEQDYEEHSTENNNENNNIVTSYLQSSLGTLTNINARSNNSRYGMIQAQIDVAKSSILLGVGQELAGYYIANNFPEYTSNNKEVTTWKTHQLEEGPFRNVLPALNEYFYVLSYGGIAALLVRTIPFVILTFFLFLNLIRKKDFSIENVAIISMCLIVIAFGLSNMYIQNYIFIVVFGIALIQLKKIR